MDLVIVRKFVCRRFSRSALRLTLHLLWKARRRGRQWRQRHDLVKFTVAELDRDLNAGKAMLSGEINGSLRMLEIKGLVRVSRPIAQAAEIQSGARMLKQNLHRLILACVWLLPRVGDDDGQSHRPKLFNESCPNL